MYKIVFMRHGESTWNLDNRFTGWTDVDLTEKGVNEARAAGQILKQEGFTFDVAYTSVLKRAIRTLWLALDEMDMMYLPIKNDWRLNERLWLWLARTRPGTNVESESTSVSSDGTPEPLRGSSLSSAVPIGRSSSRIAQTPCNGPSKPSQPAIFASA